MRTYTCIVCPNGCDITVDENAVESTMNGALCAKGREYVRQELSDPRRTISSLVAVDGGERPLVSARITAAIARARIPEAMTVIKQIRVPAPVRAGQVLLADFLEPGCNLIAVDTVAAK